MKGNSSLSSQHSPLKIVATGTRGIPNVMGGVETHCEELFPRIAAMVREKVRSCPKNCWMMGTASPVMHKYIKYPAMWALKNKLRSMQGKLACIEACWHDVGQDPRQGDLRNIN